MDAGAPLSLTWSEQSYTVLIRSFRCEFELASRLPYSLAVEVVTDNVTPARREPADTTAQVNADIDGGGRIGGNGGHSGLTSAVASIQSAMKKVQDFRTATVSQINAVLKPINEARAIATV
jgi:hypothetical protein